MVHNQCISVTCHKPAHIVSRVSMVIDDVSRPAAADSNRPTRSLPEDSYYLLGD